MLSSGAPFVTLALFLGLNLPAGATLDAVERLGKQIFFDKTLSDPPGQSCASCHVPEAGWSGPDSDINAKGAVYGGAVHGRFGKRKPTTAAYATQSPPLHFDQEEGLFEGGNFWDGRATGWLLGSPTADQAQGPFLNSVEQNNPHPQAVVETICQGGYGADFRNVFGTDICGHVVHAYNAVAQAVAAYEASREVNAFSSKYDHFLSDPQKYPLSASEKAGLELFEREDKGNCAACHPSQPGPGGEPPLFTDFTFDNLGVPRNPDNSWYHMDKTFNPQGVDWVDLGLGGFLRTVPRFKAQAEAQDGKQRVPTLRNVDRRPRADFVKAFAHNGYFKSLKAIVHFYNTRDTLVRCAELADPKPGANCWPEPEISVNVNQNELGDLGLNEEEEEAIVAFMRALSDGWQPPRDKDVVR
ncbi:MAG: cytochrome C [Gammaproteobacteria bacterium]|nr:cytochrome C [Gammaproteobacteria bacterium]